MENNGSITLLYDKFPLFNFDKDFFQGYPPNKWNTKIEEILYNGLEWKGVTLKKANENLNQPDKSQP